MVWLAACGPGGRPSPPCTFTGTGDSARVFAVTHRIHVDDASSLGTFTESFRRHVDNARDCLSHTQPNVLLFPEDSGLVAWFTGRQGLAGRRAGDSGAAFTALYAQNYQAADAYRRRFPGISDARALTLALSDRGWRAMDRAFGLIAKEANAWVITSANLPYSDLVSGPIFRDPDASGLAYVASSPEVFNAALVYAPTGERVGRVDKVFLTDPEEQTLGLTSAPLESLGLVQLPFAKVGIATSRDAFYAPFAQRLDDLGADFVVQPEAFSGWTGEEHAGDWLPDVMLASGWNLTQKYTSVRHTAAPMLTGNLFELTFDGQAFITSKATPGSPRRGFIASETNLGFEAIGAWAFDEPDPSAPLAVRQSAVRELGKDLLPSSHDAESGRTADSVIGADLHFDGDQTPRPHPAGTTASVTVAASARGHQRNPAVAYGADNRAWVAWSDFRSGVARTWIAHSDDDGATWLEAHAVDPEPGMSSQLRPTIAAGTDGFVVVAWQDSARGSDQIRWAVSRDAAKTFVASSAEQSPRSQWEPSVVAFGHTGWALAWTDFRNGLAPHVRVRCFDLDQPEPAPSRPIDPSTFELPRVQPSQLQPSLTGNRRDALFAAWVDYRDRDWQVRGRGGALCELDGKSTQLSPPSPTEVLASDPQALAAADGRVLIAWDEVRDRRGHHDVAAAEITRGVLQMLGSPPRAAHSRFRPSPYWLGGFRAAVQDLAPGKNSLSIWRPGPERPSRADDSADAPNQLTRPRAAARMDSAAAVVVFEDDRDGWIRLRSQTVRP